MVSCGSALRTAGLPPRPDRCGPEDPDEAKEREIGPPARCAAASAGRRFREDARGRRIAGQVLAGAGHPLADIIRARIAVVAVASTLAPGAGGVFLDADPHEGALPRRQAAIDRAAVPVVADGWVARRAEPRDTRLRAIARISIVAVVVARAAVLDPVVDTALAVDTLVGRARVAIVAVVALADAGALGALVK